MAVVKNTNSDYVIYCDGGAGNLIINAATEVFGNLSASGAFVTVAANNNGVINNMGMLARTSLTTWAGLRFNSPLNRWEVSPNVTDDGSPITDYTPFGSGADGYPQGPYNSLQYNDNGELNGSDNLLFDAANSTVTLDGYEYFVEQGNVPNAVANMVALYANTPGSGQTGLYFTQTDQSDELISAKQALLYSIIF